jgi:lipopolysaccharide export system permease protein
MWLSSAVLLATGSFLTYKAVNDSVILNADTYIDNFKRFIGKRELRKIEKKEVIMETPDYNLVLSQLRTLRNACADLISGNRHALSYINYQRNCDINNRTENISSQLETVVETLGNSDRILVLNKAMDFPYINGFKLFDVPFVRRYGLAFAIVFPIGLLIYLAAAYNRRIVHQDVLTTIRVADEMTEIINNYGL